MVIGKKRYLMRMGHYDTSRPHNRRWCNLKEDIHYEKISVDNRLFRVELIETEPPATSPRRSGNNGYKDNNTISESDIESDVRLNRLIYNAKNYKDSQIYIRCC